MDCSTAPDLIAGAKPLVICITTSSPHGVLLLLAVLTPLIGLAALVLAARNIQNARELARNKATLDLIEKRESTAHYRAINERFSDLRRGRGFTHLNNPTEKDKPDREAVVDYLNHYELVAIGIQQGLLDTTLYRAWMEGAFVRDWNAATPWVQRERWKANDDGSWTYRASILQNYQKVALSWSAETIALDDSTGPPNTPAGPGDEPLPEPVDKVDLGD